MISSAKAFQLIFQIYLINQLHFIICHKKMGNSCHPGAGKNQFTLEYFLDKYGKQTMLDLAFENIKKEQIQQKIPQLSKKYQQCIHSAKIDSIRQVNILEASIIDQMQTKIKQIQKSDTGEIHKAQTHYNKCAQQLMGRQQIKEDCNQLRKKIMSTYEQEEKKVKEKIENDFKAYIDAMIKEKRSKFSQTQTLTEENRLFIRKEMRSKFKKQIAAYRKQLAKQIQEGKIVDLVHLKSDFSDLHPHEEVQQIRVKGERLMRKGQTIIMGTDILGVNTKEILPPAVGFWGCC